MVRKMEEKQNKDVKILNNEINVLKKHIQQLNFEVQNKLIQPNLVRWPNNIPIDLIIISEHIIRNITDINRQIPIKEIIINNIRKSDF